MKLKLTPTMLKALESANKTTAYSYEVHSEGLQTTFGGNRNSFNALIRRGLVKRLIERGVGMHPSEAKVNYVLTVAGHAALESELNPFVS